MPRIGGRPNLDRVLVSFYLDRESKDAVDRLATEAGKPKADVYREIIGAGVAKAAPPVKAVRAGARAGSASRAVPRRPRGK